MPFQIETPKPAEAAEIANVIIDSSSHSPMARSHLLSYPVSDEAREWHMKFIKEDWENGILRIVRDTDTGKIISYCRYGFEDLDNSQKWKQAPPHPKAPPEIFRVEELISHIDTCFQQRIKHMGNRAYLNFRELCTLPTFGRRGAGSMMVKHAVDEAEKYNLPIFLIATADGKGLYEKFGFAVMEPITFDMSVINEPPETFWAMIRQQPKPDEPATAPALPLRPVRVVDCEATMEECLAFDKCTKAAFVSEPLIELAFFAAEPEPEEVSAAKLLKDVQNTHDFLVQKAIDEKNGEALGYSKWMLCDDPHRDMHPFGPGWPQGANVPLCEEVFGKVENIRRDHFREINEPYIYLASLMILPTAQRRGVGSALIRAGLAVSDARGWAGYVNASPAGAPLYRKFGWEDFVSRSVNLKDYGGPDHVDTVIGLKRKCAAKEKPRKETAT